MDPQVHAETTDREDDAESEERPGERDAVGGLWQGKTDEGGHEDETE